MHKVLVTGGAGFIGSNYIKLVLDKADSMVVNLDKLTYAANLDNLSFAQDHDNYHFVEGDICDAKLVDSLFDRYDFDRVVHFAAESHVDNSIDSPAAFVQTNIVGTFNLLSAAYNHWMQKPFVFKEGQENNRFLHISTDEVYGSLGDTGLFTEQTPYAPNSPYSASKASSDMLVRSYFHTYGMPVVTTNCSNNYGPHQHKEKLIPTIIRKALAGEDIPIYGDGSNVRDWLYVMDHCSGIDLALNKGTLGETYNIGGNNEYANLTIAKHICGVLDTQFPAKNNKSYSDQISFVADRPGHDFRYAIDASKISNDLGWKPKEDFLSGIKKTVSWYLEHKNRLQ
ncbi:MAG: dTDP-glucose 4,6-dehydratase [Gilvibacter sp.]